MFCCEHPSPSYLAFVVEVWYNSLDNVRFDLTPTPWPPSPSEFGIRNSEFGGEGKGVGGWGEVHLDRHVRSLNIVE